MCVICDKDEQEMLAAHRPEEVPGSKSGLPLSVPKLKAYLELGSRGFWLGSTLKFSKTLGGNR